MNNLSVLFPSSMWAVLFQEKDISFSGEHVREGLTCIVSVKVPNPEFEGQTKVCLLFLFGRNF